jgi:hypothetical protein
VIFLQCEFRASREEKPWIDFAIACDSVLLNPEYCYEYAHNTVHYASISLRLCFSFDS